MFSVTKIPIPYPSCRQLVQACMIFCCAPFVRLKLRFLNNYRCQGLQNDCLIYLKVFKCVKKYFDGQCLYLIPFFVRIAYLNKKYWTCKTMSGDPGRDPSCAGPALTRQQQGLTTNKTVKQNSVLLYRSPGRFYHSFSCYVL